MNSKQFSFLPLFFIWGLLCVHPTSFSQSKKEQIKVLESQIDNFNIKLSNERQVQNTFINEWKNREAQMKRTIDSLEMVIQEIDKQIVAEKKETEQLIKSISLIQLQVQQGRDSLKNLTQGINTHSTNRVLIIDSIDFIENENKYDFRLDKNPTTNPNQSAFTGLFKSYWPSSWNETYANGKKQVYATGRYKDGIKDGPWKYFLCDGKVKFEGNYKNGLRDGKWINYDLCYSFEISSLPDFDFGHYIVLLSKGYYYELRQLKNISSEEIIFTGGIPHDTLYYMNDQNLLVAKINFKTKEAFYDNNQRLSNRPIDYDYSMFPKSEKKPLEIYYRNGHLAYRMTVNNNEVKELFFNTNGTLIKKCLYINNNGNCQTYSNNGSLIDEFEACLGCIPADYQCPCEVY